VKCNDIELNLYFVVQCIVLKSENIWLSHVSNIIRKPTKYLFSKGKRVITINEKYTVIEINLYLLVQSLMLKFEKI
jgi:hypothetical protein